MASSSQPENTSRREKPAPLVRAWWPAYALVSLCLVGIIPRLIPAPDPSLEPRRLHVLGSGLNLPGVDVQRGGTRHRASGRFVFRAGDEIQLARGSSLRLAYSPESRVPTTPHNNTEQLPAPSPRSPLLEGPGIWRVEAIHARDGFELCSAKGAANDCRRFHSD